MCFFEHPKLYYFEIGHYKLNLLKNENYFLRILKFYFLTYLLKFV